MSERSTGTNSSEIEIDQPAPRERVRLVRLEGFEPRKTSRDALRVAGIRSGDRLTAEQLDASLAEAEPSAALERAIRLLGHRERSRQEIESRLSRDGYPDDVAAQVVERLSGWGYLDDLRYAEGYARAKLAAGWGRDRIVRTLRERGVSSLLSHEVIERVAPPDAELERALGQVRLVESDCGDRRRTEREIARLVRKGFSFEIARAAVSRRTDGRGPETL